MTLCFPTNVQDISMHTRRSSIEDVVKGRESRGNVNPKRQEARAPSISLCAQRLMDSLSSLQSAQRA